MPELQEIIDSTPDGGTANLKGEYSGNVILDRPVSLKCKGNCILRGNGSGTGVTITNGGINIYGLTIANYGVGLHVHDVDKPTKLGHIRFVNNKKAFIIKDIPNKEDFTSTHGDQDEDPDLVLLEDFKVIKGGP